MNIRFETLQQAQDDLGAAFAAIRATIENLETELEAKLSQWTGPAQTSYWQVKQQWKTATDDMAAVLNQAHVHIGTAAEMYQAVENQNASIWHN
jgi:early secretory antigenic target protein ESAT-6